MMFSTRTFVLKPKEIGMTVLSGVQMAFHTVGDFFKDTVNSIEELQQLKTEYAALQQELFDYQTIERDYLALRHENDLLKQQLDFSQSLSFLHIPCEVIAKDPGNLFHTIIINKGTRDGVEKNMPVIAYQEGFQGLVGKVVETGKISSKVMPIFDASCYVAARMKDSRYDGLACGAGIGSDYILMSYVSKRAKEEIHFGDLVITSGMDSIYPKGIFIGRVRNISAPEWTTSLELEIEPVIDFSRLEYVFVLKAEQNEQ
jgi:rod shape-determining protein MreC